MIEIKRNKAITDRTVFEAFENGKYLGKCGGTLVGDTFEFDEIECEDFLVDGLVRAILNLMDLNGVSKARFNFNDIEIIGKLRKMGFVKNDDNTIHNIDNFFTQHKNCTNL